MSYTFPVGRVMNTLNVHVPSPKVIFSDIAIRYPARLNAMALDPGKIDVSEEGIYTPGEIIFSINIFKDVLIKVRTDKEIVISSTSPRHQLITHAVLIMQKALGVDDGLEIDVKTEDLKHCGFGSSSGLISAIAVAINEIYGKPISNHDLIAYLAQNHGEEINGNNNDLQHVQCIGGSATSGLVLGGMKVIAGKSVPICSMNIEDDYTVIIGIPTDFIASDAKTLMDLETKNLDKFVRTGKEYGEKIGYRVTHETIPAMVQGNLRKASELIFDYRFDYGSIENCSFVYPGMTNIAKNIRFLFEQGLVDTLSLSSVGPAFFAITKNPEECEKVFVDNGMKTIRTTIANDGYQIINSKSV